MTIKNKIKKILAILNAAYGKPPGFRKNDPTDVLIRTVLSQNTTDKNSVPAFYALKRRFASWKEVAAANTGEIASLIRHAGLAKIKAARIKEVLAEIRGRDGERRDKKGREGKINLGFLVKMDVKDSIEYLESLKGVGPKTAACVLLFGFGKSVMPVDTHIFRVTKRLGIIDDKVNIKEAHRILTDIVPNGLIYEFHLGIIEHGRKTCKAQNPRCGVCVVYRLCKFEDKAIYRERKV